MRLVIQTYGANLSLDSGMIVIETDDTQREVSLLHVTSIHIQTNARISTALIEACMNGQIPVFFENDMHITALIWSPRYGSFARIRRQQALFSLSHLRFRLIRQILINKNTERLRWLRKHTRRPENLERMARIEQINEQIRQAPDEADKIRSLEAHASKIYFRILNDMLPQAFRFDKRTYRHSRDPFNIMLNYAYGMLYNLITKALIHAGLDPDIGFFHAVQYNRPALAYDIIENYRPWVEHWLYILIKSGTLEPLMPVVDEEGRLRTEPKRALIEHIFNQWENTRIRHKNRTRSPMNHIYLDAQDLARYILNLDTDLILKHIDPNPKP